MEKANYIDIDDRSFDTQATLEYRNAFIPDGSHVMTDPANPCAQVVSYPKQSESLSRALKWAAHGVLGLLLLFSMGATASEEMLADKPVLTVDYLAKMNETLKAVPEDDQAWPIYRKAILDSGILNDEDFDVTRGTDGQPLNPKHPEWRKVVDQLLKYRNLISAIHTGAQKPALGFKWSTQISKEDEPLFKNPQADANEQPLGVGKMAEESFAAVRLQHFSGLRQLSRLLSADTLRALELMDSRRAIKDIEAQFAFAKQSQAYETGITALITSGFMFAGLNAIKLTIHEDPRIFSDEELKKLATLCKETLAGTHLSGQGELYEMLDVYQCIYGQSGKIAHDGLIFLAMRWADAPGYPQGMDLKTYTEQASLTVLPELRENTASHDEIKAKLLELHNAKIAYQKLPLWEQIRTESQEAVLLRQWTESPAGTKKYWPLMINDGDQDRFSQVFTKQAALQKACLVAIALEQYRRANQQYPDTLAKLVPDYLDQTPIDYSTGQPLLFKLVDGKPLLYGRGLDGDDDGGVQEDPSKNNMNMPSQGDWILFP